MALLISVGTQTYSSSSTYRTPAIPSGTAPPYYMIAWLAKKNSESVTKPADWTEIGSTTSGSFSIHAYGKFHDGSETNPTFSWTTACGCMAIITTFSHVDDTPIDVAWSGSGFSAPSSPYDVTIPGVSSLTDASMILAFIASEADNTWAKQTADFTQIFSINATAYISFALAYRALDPAGASGDCVYRQTNSAPDPGAYATFVLQCSEHQVEVGGLGATVLRESHEIDSLGVTVLSGEMNVEGFGATVISAEMNVEGMGITVLADPFKGRRVFPLPPSNRQLQSQSSKRVFPLAGEQEG